MGVVGTLAAAALFDVTTTEQAGQVGAIQEIAFALGAGLGIAVFGAIAIALDRAGFGVALIAAAAVAAAAALLPALSRAGRRASVPPIASASDVIDPVEQPCPER